MNKEDIKNFINDNKDEIGVALLLSSSIIMSYFYGKNVGQLTTEIKYLKYLISKGSKK